MERRLLLALVFVPVIVALERFAYWGAWTVTWTYATGDLNLDFDRWRKVWSVVTVIGHVAPFFGAFLAIGVGPRWVLPAGALLASAGTAAIPLTNSAHLLTPLLVTALGAGMVRACVYAALADVIPDPRESVRIAAMMVVFLGINGVSLLSSLTAPEIAQRFGSASVFYGAAAIHLLVVPVALLYAILHRFSPATLPPSDRIDARAIFGTALLLVISIPWILARNVSDRLPTIVGASGLDLVRFHAINPAVTMVATFLAAGALAACALFGVRVRALLLAGAGLLITAAGTIPVVVAPSFAAAAVATMAIGAVGEALVWPALLSRAAAGHHWRWAAVLVAVFTSGYLAEILLTKPLEWAGPNEGTLMRLLLGFAGVSCAVLGAAAVIGHRAASRFFWPEEPDPVDTAAFD